MAILQLNGVPIAYSDTRAPSGRADAPAIVFGHGLLFSGWQFAPQIAALRERFRCVTIDWRGQGETPPSASGYDMDSLAADAVALIEHLDLGPVHYVGLSMGGFVGQRIAARRGELLRTLTLLDTSPDREEPKAARQDKLLAAVYRFTGVRPVAAPVKRLMFGPAFRADPAARPVIDEFIRRVARCDRAGVSKAVLAVANRAPIYDEIDRISVPTLVIVGADDIPTPVAKARRIVERIPGARLAIVPNAGHSSPLEQPAEVTELIEQFLATAG